MPVTRETLRIMHQVHIDLEAVEDMQTRELVAAWVRAWGEVAGQLREAVLDLTLDAVDGRVSRATAMRSSRLARALTVIAAALEDLGTRAGVIITGDLQAVVEDTAGVQGRLVDSQLPPGVSGDFDRVDPAAVAAVVARTAQQVEAVTRPLVLDAVTAMRREMVRSIVVGDNPRRAADRMVARAKGRFDGGLTRALVIARTEMADAHREASQLAHQRDADLLTGWQWVATLGPRTCPGCWGMHGRVFDLAEPGPLDHHQGRCARLPKTRSWADLGFDIVEPPDLLPDAEATFRSLTTQQQRQILGPKRYDAWLSGGFPLSAWATRRRNDGWRDSYVPADPASSSLLSAAS